MSDDMEMEVEEKSGKEDKWEVESLVRSIKEVQIAKTKKPELYKKALKMLGEEVDAIRSIDDLRRVAASKSKGVSKSEA
jgi:hypothetical protein